MKEQEDYRYNDPSERYCRMNKVYIITTTILLFLFMVYLLLKLGTKNIAVPTALGNLLFIICFTVINLVTYFHDKSSHKFKQFVIIEIAIEFTLLGLQTNAEFIYYAALGVLAL